MSLASLLARRARAASALSLAAFLAAGLWAPRAQAIPDPNPPLRSGNGAGDVDRARRGDRPNSDALRGDALRGDALRGDALRGTVARALGPRSFDLRSNDGHIYRVNTRVAIGLEAGTAVRVMGDLNGSTFDARLITVGDFGSDRPGDVYDAPSNDGNYGNGNYGDGNYNGGYDSGAPDDNGQTVTLTGRIVAFYSRTEFDVRDDDDGRVYRVRTRTALPNSVRVGDRTQTRGQLNGNSIRAEFSREFDGTIGDPVGNPNAGVFVNFSGPITSIDSNRGEARVRAGNGYTYTLRARPAELDRFRTGQTVRVQGNWLNERVEVTQLTRE